MTIEVQHRGYDMWDVKINDDTWHWANFNGVLYHLQRELTMRYTHLLELSVAEPRQYRITVVEDRAGAILDVQLNKETDGFNLIGWYDTPEELLAVLVPYLQMEGGK